MTAASRLNAAMSRAWGIFCEIEDGPTLVEPRLEIESRTDFSAFVSRDGRTIRVATGLVDQLDALWSVLWQTTVLTGDSSAGNVWPDPRTGTCASDHTDLSLVWLFLHELMHVRLEHGRLVGSAGLVEVGPPEDAIADMATDLSELLAEEDRSKIRRCLELQADDDATKLFMGRYAPERSNDVRARAVCIFTVMAMIERENERLGNRNISHPAAITRFFVLLTGLTMLWARADTQPYVKEDGHTYLSGGDLNVDDFDAFVEAVLRPLVDDVILVVSAAKATTFITDLRGSGPLFHDMGVVLYGDELSDELFLTHAAREWLGLATTNDRVLRFLGHRG